MILVLTVKYIEFRGLILTPLGPPYLPYELLFVWQSWFVYYVFHIGLHLEGPFISKEKKGAHDVNLIQTFDNGMVDLTKIYGEDLTNVAIVTLAPELAKSGEVIKELVERGIKVSVGV